MAEDEEDEGEEEEEEETIRRDGGKGRWQETREVKEEDGGALRHMGPDYWLNGDSD